MLLYSDTHTGYSYTLGFTVNCWIVEFTSRKMIGGKFVIFLDQNSATSPDWRRFLRLRDWRLVDGISVIGWVKPQLAGNKHTGQVLHSFYIYFFSFTSFFLFFFFLLWRLTSLQANFNVWVFKFIISWLGFMVFIYVLEFCASISDICLFCPVDEILCFYL